MKLTRIVTYLFIFVIMLLFILYDTYLIEESFDNIYDAKVNSLYLHDENSNVRQVTFDVNVPLNRYYVNSTTTPAPQVPENSEESTDSMDNSPTDSA